MPTRTGSGSWSGSVEEGSGNFSVESGAFEANFSLPSRFEDGSGSNPEELIGAAQAGCYSMALSLILGEEGFEPGLIETDADVTIVEDGEGFTITDVALRTEARVPDIDDETFQEIAGVAKQACPVSKALAGPDITLEATLVD